MVLHLGFPGWKSTRVIKHRRSDYRDSCRLIVTTSKETLERCERKKDGELQAWDDDINY